MGIRVGFQRLASARYPLDDQAGVIEIRNAFIAGSGLMDSGIAQVCAIAGLQVTFRLIFDSVKN